MNTFFLLLFPRLYVNIKYCSYFKCIFFFVCHLGARIIYNARLMLPCWTVLFLVIYLVNYLLTWLEKCIFLLAILKWVFQKKKFTPMLRISIFLKLTPLENHVFALNFGIPPWNSNYFYSTPWNFPLISSAGGYKSVTIYTAIMINLMFKI